ncbi:MAG TPA: TadE family protein [Acidimicrobiales bacterium]|nr:TadE family protein [Acidimicrobiales bacterium]
MEFALVSLLFVLFIYAVAVFGVMLSTKNSITHAATEGARSALSVADLPAATLDSRRITQATTTAGNSLTGSLGSHYHPSDVSASIAGCDSVADTHKCITVTITYPWQSDPIVPLAPGMGLATPTNIRATAVVRLD